MQYGKSLSHLQIQLHLKALEPQLILEKKIENRIADAVWEEKKIVFEIQFSPISLEEVQNRCRDYQRLGYTPIWILHDRRFNRPWMSPAEEYLRTHATTFFTDGHHFYDLSDDGDKVAVDPFNPVLSKIKRGKRDFIYKILIYKLLESCTK